MRQLRSASQSQASQQSKGRRSRASRQRQCLVSSRFARLGSPRTAARLASAPRQSRLDLVASGTFGERFSASAPWIFVPIANLWQPEQLRLPRQSHRHTLPRPQKSRLRPPSTARSPNLLKRSQASPLSQLDPLRPSLPSRHCQHRPSQAFPPSRQAHHRPSHPLRLSRRPTLPSFKQ